MELAHAHHRSDIMMTSSNGNIFCIAGPLCMEITCDWWIPSQRAVTRSFDVFFELRLNKWLSKQSRRWWFEMPSCSLRRHSNDTGNHSIHKSNRFKRKVSSYLYRNLTVEIRQYQDGLTSTMGSCRLVKGHNYIEYVLYYIRRQILHTVKSLI